MSDVAQGTEAWRLERVGHVTGSRISDVMAKIKSGGYSATRAAYMGELLVERLSGAPVEKFQSAAMKRGTEMEPQARAAYTFLRREVVEEVGFCPHPTIPMAGASADGLVGSVGIVEFKNPEVHTHVDTLLGSSIPKAYRDQAQFNLACRPERQWVDFVSHCDLMPAGMDVFIQRIPRDPEYIAEIETEVRKFLAELDAKVSALRARYGQEAA